MTIRFAIRAAAAVLLVCPATPAAAQRQTPASFATIDAWVKAVTAHVPGQPDAPAGAAVAMTYEQRRNLNTSLPLFLRVLCERDVVFTRSEFDKAITRLARATRLTVGPWVFLARAAVLHSDAVVFARRFPPAPDDAPPPAPGGGGREPPLLTRERVTLTRDGEVYGDAPVRWHLPFARSLLDELLRPVAQLVLPAECPADAACPGDDMPPSVARAPRVFVPTRPVTPADRAFVSEWYHAVTAYLFAQGMNGDATSHLQAAARVLPDDPRLLFDRGTYAETLGLPIYQAVRETVTARPNTFVSRIPSEDKMNAEAEGLYRRALEIDAGYVEARVRLARLLERRARHDEAATHIAKALDAQPTGVVGFYARIVAGRVAAARRRYDEALQHYRAASTLYASAQSALLGASHAALMLADLPGTLAAIEPLGTDSARFDADPWLDYQLGAGREVNALMTELWTNASKDR